MAKYPYIVNKDGVWYPAGAEVPEDANLVENKKVEEVNKNDFSQFMNPPVEDNTTKYTKTEINRMSTAELKEIATNEKIIGAKNMTGTDLKKVLIEKFEL